MKTLALTLPGGIQVNSAGDAPGNATIGNIVQTAFDLAIIAAIIFCLFVLIYAGVQWLISGGNKEKIKNQQQRVVFALIGLIVVFMSVFLINMVGNFFNLKLLGSPTL